MTGRTLAVGTEWAALAVLLVALCGFVAGPGISLIMSGATILAVLYAARRPAAALLALAFVVPLSGPLADLTGLEPLRRGEILVVAFLAGWLMHRRARSGASEPLPAGIVRPVAWFGLIVVSSVIVRLGLWQAAAERPSWSFVFDRVLFRYLLAGSDALAEPVYAGALLLEGAGIFIAAWDVSRASGGWRTRAAWAMVLAGCVASVMTAASITRHVWAAADWRQAIGELGEAARLSVHLRDPNAAASLYVLLLLLLCGMVWRKAGRLPVLALGAVGLLLAGLGMAGSRIAMLAGAAGFLILLAKVRSWGLPGRRTLIGVLAGTIVAGGMLLPRIRLLFDSDFLNLAVMPRLQLIRTGLQMWSDAPWFGVGVGRFFPMSARFRPIEVQIYSPVENAHNYFLQTGAELGLLGLAAFVWWVGAAVVTAWRDRAPDQSGIRAGAIAGVGAFLATCLTGHPLLVRPVAVLFWIVLALAAAGAAAAPAGGPACAAVPGRRWAGAGARAFAALMLLTVAAVPWRMWSAMQPSNLAGLDLGFYPTEVDQSVLRFFRWTSSHALLYVPARTTRVEFELLAEAGNAGPQRVRTLVDGAVASDLLITHADWTTVSVPASGEGEVPHQIEWTVEPPWVPARRLPGNTDERVLGIAVARITKYSR